MPILSAPSCPKAPSSALGSRATETQILEEIKEACPSPSRLHEERIPSEKIAAANAFSDDDVDGHGFTEDLEDAEELFESSSQNLRTTVPLAIQSILQGDEDWRDPFDDDPDTSHLNPDKLDPVSQTQPRRFPPFEEGMSDDVMLREADSVSVTSTVPEIQDSRAKRIDAAPARFVGNEITDETDGLGAEKHGGGEDDDQDAAATHGDVDAAAGVVVDNVTITPVASASITRSPKSLAVASKDEFVHEHRAVVWLS